MSGPAPKSAGVGRIALAVVAGALGTALIGGALWAIYDARAPRPTRQTEIDPAEETGSEETTTASAGGTETGSPSATSAPDAGGGAARPGDTPPAVQPAPMIAYRLGGRIWVAREDGSTPVDVAPSSGTYALAPSGKVLAFIMGAPRSTGKVVFYEVKTSGTLRMGGMGAYPGWIAWDPSSSRVAYSAGTMEASSLRIVSATGSGDRELVSPGAKARFSPDGRIVAYRQSGVPDAGEQISVISLSGGRAQAVAGAQAALSFAFAASGELYFTKPGTGGAWEIWRSKPPYTASSKIGSIQVKAPAYALCDLSVSRDSRYLLTGARGDDQYCRVWVIDTGSGKATAIQTRRDATPYGWSSTGRVLYFEGNTYQGESSSLMSAKPDGSSRRVVVEGAAP